VRERERERVRERERERERDRDRDRESLLDIRVESLEEVLPACSE
jgi:hypothetical protein